MITIEVLIPTDEWFKRKRRKAKQHAEEMLLKKAWSTGVLRPGEHFPVDTEITVHGCASQPNVIAVAKINQ